VQILIDDKKQENGRDTNGMFRNYKERKRFIKCCRENFFWVSSFFTFIASCLGLFSLWVFAGFIGRPDIFIQSLEFGPSLILLVPFFLLIYGVLIAYFILPSWFFWSELRCFKSERDSVVGVGFWLLPFGAVASFASVAALARIYWGRDGWPFCWFFICVLFGFIFIYIFVVLYGGGSKESAVCANVKKRVRSFLWLVFVMVAVAICNAVLSILYQYAFRESGVGLKDFELFLVLLFVSVNPLLPVVFFQVMAKKGGVSQIVGGALGVLLFHLGLFVGMFNIFGAASASSMMFLGVVDMEPKRYLIDGNQYPKSSLNDGGRRWSIEQHGESHYSVKAVVPYSYGRISLLCPIGFVGSKGQNSEPQSGAKQRQKWHDELNKLRLKIQDCIPFQSDEIRKLDTRPITAEETPNSGMLR